MDKLNAALRDCIEMRSVQISSFIDQAIADLVAQGNLVDIKKDMKVFIQTISNSETKYSLFFKGKLVAERTFGLTFIS